MARHESVWRAGHERTPNPALDRDRTTDVCVVGAGIAGLSTAVEAALAGLKVVVLEATAVGAGETSMTSAHLTNVFDVGFTTVERHAGLDATRLAANAHMDAIARIEQFSAEHGIASQFQRVDGYLFAHEDAANADVDSEFDVATRCNVPLWKPIRLKESPVGPKKRAALQFPNQGIFHPLAHLHGLARVLESQGGTLYENSHVTAVHSGEPSRVETAEGPAITARFVVVATNSPMNDLVAMHTKQAPYHTYVVGMPVPSGSVEAALYWDTNDPFHYVRLLPGGGPDGDDLLIVGGEDHKAAHESDCDARWNKLETWARRHFPEAKSPAWLWSGQVLNSIDGLGYFGRNPMDSPNVFIATGDTGMGLTGGTLAGMIIRDLMLDRPNPYAGVFDPSRKPVTAVTEFVKEQVDVAVQYTDWVTPGEVDNVDAVKRNSGAIVRRGPRKFAVSRSAQGKLTCLSAVCTHLGCIVGWNPGATTWDCPCHGSRFRPDGSVIHGPASRPLAPVDEAEVVG
jgi:glycine/D-amino acid oxidase-like deaminating enzyme/nitrite reductase/ring-hydroxylating ferredoxin subunit